MLSRAAWPTNVCPQASSIIEWLTSPQAIEARLRANAGDTNAASELRSLQREIASWSVSQSDGGPE